MKFTEFNFGNELQEGLDMMGFEKATPIQEQAIPIIQNNKDLIACAQTGTGKTAAFVLPILDILTKETQNNKVNTIIIAPTRELAKQIDMQIEGFSYFTNASSYPIYGGGTGVEIAKLMLSGFLSNLLASSLIFGGIVAENKRVCLFVGRVFEIFMMSS